MRHLRFWSRHDRVVRSFVAFRDDPWICALHDRDILSGQTLIDEDTGVRLCAT